MSSEASSSKPSTAALSAGVRRLVIAGALALEPVLDAIGDQAAAHAHDVLPDLGEDRALRRETARGARATLAALIRLVTEEEPASAISAPPELLAAFGRAARRGVPLSSVIEALSIGHELVLGGWDAQIAALATSPAEMLAATQTTRRYTFAVSSAIVSSAQEQYAAEGRRNAGARAAARLRTAKALIAGDVADADAAGVRLGYDLARRHVGLVIWSGDLTHRADPAALVQAAESVADALGAGRPLVIEATDHQLWAWVALPRDSGLHELADVVGQPALGGPHVAIGDPSDGIAGFRRSHLQAVAAARVVASAPSGQGRRHRYRALRLPALLGTDGAEARRFVEDELGALRGQDPETAELRATLGAWLAERGSLKGAAARLGVHPNTVANRLAHCRRLRDGQPVWSLELWVALSLAEHLDDAP